MLPQDGENSSAFTSGLWIFRKAERAAAFYRIEPMILSAADEERAVTSSHET